MKESIIALITVAVEVLEEYNPMTLRQLFYQLVSRQIIDNTKSQYQRLGKAVVHGRQNGTIPWEWIEDRLRQPRIVSMWNGLEDFSETVVRSYKRDVWSTQDRYIEVWLEKDALSGLFLPILHPYGVTLNIGRGYDGWSSIQQAATRFQHFALGSDIILYFGDFDPSGEDMVQSLRKRLSFFNCRPMLDKVALTKRDITQHRLPSDFTKASDPRSAAFIVKHGNACVELDALPPHILERKIRDSIQKYMNLDILLAVATKEKKEIEKIKAMMKD